MNTAPPTACRAWSALSAHAQAAPRIADLRASDASRAARCCADADGVRLDYSRQRVDARTLRLLGELAQERDLAAWRDALFSAAPVNSTENRAAWHTALRAGSAAPDEVKANLSRARGVAQRLRDGEWRGATGRTIRRIVNLGTGGSDLGPRLLVDALASPVDYEPAAPRDGGLEFAFAANVDPLDLERALAGANPETTLFVVVSKTFTTQETMENARAARARLARALPQGAALERHFIAATGNEAAARAFGVAEALVIPDWVGGRYSVWSSAGFSALAALGPERFDEFLAGGAEIDAHFRTAPLERNLPALMALLGIWNVNFLGAATHAVLPYSNALRLLPGYLQQLEMESNGKSVDREGRSIDYATAPVVWGAEGTVGQHSFHQLLHQGTQTVPADFIVFGEAPGDSGRRAILAAHATAQAEALAAGRDDPLLPAHRRHPGNRPSSTLTFERLDARNLGRLIALYEHKVFVQGVIWNINSFDQWGVEFGKQLAAEILERRGKP
jgi:glucose-6-phosphate isomerase